MARFSAPGGVTVKEFFVKHVPVQFREIAVGADAKGMAGRNFTLQFNVADEKYCLDIQGGTKLDIIEGGIENPILAFSLAESDWREAVSGKSEGVIDRFIDPTQIADSTRYAKLLATKGTMKVELAKEDGTTVPFSMTFNGQSSPSVTIRLKLTDWVAMQKKEVNGPALFMTGKLKVSGDMMFLMALQTLL